MVNAYSQNERTNLLKENVQSVSGTISSSLIMQDINSRYSVEKELMCESLYIISNSIDADVFVCDVEGNIILCKERAYSTPYFGSLPPAPCTTAIPSVPHCCNGCMRPAP